MDCGFRDQPAHATAMLETRGDAAVMPLIAHRSRREYVRRECETAAHFGLLLASCLSCFRLSAWFNSLPTATGMPTFAANAGLCATAAISFFWAGDLLGMTIPHPVGQGPRGPGWGRRACWRR